MKKTIKQILDYSSIDGLIPGIRGQRALPSKMLAHFDPFLLLDQIGPQLVAQDFFFDGTGGAHPHRGFETVTFVFSGILDHVDSLGNKIQLSSGSVQRMNAGKGIIHGGNLSAHSESNEIHEIQLWVNVPQSQKMSEPSIQNVGENEIPIVETQEAKVRVIAGEFHGKRGPISTTIPTTILHLISVNELNVTLSKLSVIQDFMVYVLKGNFNINDVNVSNFQSVLFNNDGNEIDLKGSGELLILGGQPIREPVVQGGPFVMNSEEEIKQAYADYRNGKFGGINHE
jgi:redox-sensitive bicupin YhaK (pirin superfamily)